MFWKQKAADLQAGQKLFAEVVMQPATEEMYSKITGSIPARTDVDLTAEGFTDGQRNSAQNLRNAIGENRVVLSLAHNMAQPNGITAAMIGIEPYMLNSLEMAIPATIVSTLLGALAGYSIALWRFPGDGLVFGLVTLGVCLPEQMKLIPWVVVLRDLALTNTIAGLILIHVVQGMSFTTLLRRNHYVGIPADLLKAARIDGAGFFRIFWRIVLPLSPPILIVAVIWQFTGIWNEFLFALLF